MTDIIIIIICLPVIIPHYHNCIYSVHLLYTFVGVFNEILLLLLVGVASFYWPRQIMIVQRRAYQLQKRSAAYGGDL